MLGPPIAPLRNDDAASCVRILAYLRLLSCPRAVSLWFHGPRPLACHYLHVVPPPQHRLQGTAQRASFWRKGSTTENPEQSKSVYLIRGSASASADSISMLGVPSSSVGFASVASGGCHGRDGGASGCNATARRGAIEGLGARDRVRCHLKLTLARRC